MSDASSAPGELRYSGAMSADLRPLIEARRRLKYTTPLSPGDDLYVPRADSLGEKIRSRVVDAEVRQLLLAGPTGCGKTTELLRCVEELKQTHTVVFCPYDRDVGVRLDRRLFARYLLWRAATEAFNNPDKIRVHPDFRKTVEKVIGDVSKPIPFRAVADVTRAYTYAGDLQVREAPATDELIEHLIAEVLSSQPNFLLVIDGLEKLPMTVTSADIGTLLQAPFFQSCQSVLVIPPRLRFGWSALTRAPELADTGVELLPIKIDQSLIDKFIIKVILNRCDDVLQGKADLYVDINKHCGSIVRDAIQIAADACQAALDDRAEKVKPKHIKAACQGMREAFLLVLSDDTPKALHFLKETKTTGRLPPDPTLRDLTISLNLVLENSDGTFRTHPLLDEVLAEQAP